MDDINELSFEQAYQELEESIARLESGELPLEDSVALYEKGRLLATHCQKLLDNAELRIKKIDDSGTIRDNL
jgi:exodeoxyribonuclease VII small subunit